MSESYEGRQVVGIDLHRRRSVIVRMTEDGQLLETVRIVNDPQGLGEVMTWAGEAPEVVLEQRVVLLDHQPLQAVSGEGVDQLPRTGDAASRGSAIAVASYTPSATPVRVTVLAISRRRAAAARSCISSRS